MGWGQYKGGFLAVEEASRIMAKQEDAESKQGTKKRKGIQLHSKSRGRSRRRGETRKS